MPNHRFVSLAFVVTALFLAPALSSSAPADFTAFLATLDAAQLELQNGRPANFKALWSHRDDVTLSGGFGGPIEKGWDAVSRRLDWVGTQFSNGTNRIERIVSNEAGDLGYVVQAEHLRFRVPATVERIDDRLPGDDDLPPRGRAMAADPSAGGLAARQAAITRSQARA